MKWLLAKLILLAIAVGLIFGLQSHGGSVTIWWADWRVDLALSTAILALGLLVIILVSMIRIWGWVGRLPARIKNYRRQAYESRKLQRLTDLTLDYLEGRYARVTRSAAEFDKEFRDLDALRSPLLRMVAVLAARAAHRLRDTQLRDQWLEKARDIPQGRWRSDHPQLHALTQAEFSIEDQDGPSAVQVLQPALEGDRRHIHGTRLLLKAYELSGNWGEVLRLSRLLENRNALHATLIQKYKQTAFRGLLSAAGIDPVAIKQVVDRMNSAERVDPVFVVMVAQAWILAGGHREARQMLESALKKVWDPRLLEVYADCSDNPREQFSRLEDWAHSHPESFELKWAMGRLSQNQGLWGKAELHLQRALEIRPAVRVSLALAEVADAQGKVEDARRHWLQAARLAQANRLSS